MKLIRTTDDRFVFHLGQREKHLLLEILKLYPRIPSAHQRLSRTGKLPDLSGDQRLLDEALAEQRAENKQRLAVLLASPRRFEEQGSGWRFSVSAAELEWLLQVLNDIRVGSWVILGSPEERIGELNEQTAPHLLAMEMAGFFQMHLLEAFGGGGR